MGKNSKKRKQPPTASLDVADSNNRLSTAVKKLKAAPALGAAASVVKKVKEVPGLVHGSDSDDSTLAPSTPPLEKGKQVAVVAGDSDLIGGVIYEDELETTTDTLRLLAQNPSLIALKALKPFKTAVHDYWRVANEVGNTGSSLTSRISSALVDQRHTDALVLLSEMAIREQLPKLGALQRWVRECDAVLTPTMSREEENKVWQVLDAILRTTQPEMVSRAKEGEDEGEVKEGTRLRWFKPFSVDPGPATYEPSADEAENRVSEKIAAAASSTLKPLQTTPGPERRPPNKHPLTLYFTPPTQTPPIPITPLDKRTRQPSRHSLPGVPGAFIINDALESFECESIVQMAEKIGMSPDEPIAGSAAQLASVLAHNLVWVADEQFVGELFKRIEDLLPQEVHGGKVRGINRRFRIYRYRPGALYRPHIDGAWPASSIASNSSSTTESPTYSYIYDSDPTTYSRLTLLIYLNDSFSGGHTTFFLPSSVPGILEARPIRPRTGTVAVFPHGAARGSLLHEGSGVIEGAKYVIRTEILYEVDAKERVDGTALPGPM
ncbi:hypothetical protein CVT26_005880 [Gymnopilus dilepis]|uniref:Fe2OG dioxygenase domain-containing protein n=1 Tax=Gymnopilus dilepis TaxID=231916 RepID=A0A409Y1G5_9AGAR|nr:hypothetical protein CVT26_005880 [Gymnopilus dilepis]